MRPARIASAAAAAVAGRDLLLHVGFASGLLLAAVTAPAAAQEPHTLADVAFLSGCWAGDMGALRIEEQWGSPTGGAMLGTTRYLRDGAVVDWEFARLVETAEGVTLWPYPRGVVSANGFPLVSADSGAVFENLEHDFPVRIMYAREGDDALAPRIEGADGQGRSWALRRVTCPG